MFQQSTLQCLRVRMYESFVLERPLMDALPRGRHQTGTAEKRGSEGRTQVTQVTLGAWCAWCLLCLVVALLCLVRLLLCLLGVAAVVGSRMCDGGALEKYIHPLCCHCTANAAHLEDGHVHALGTRPRAGMDTPSRQISRTAATRAEGPEALHLSQGRPWHAPAPVVRMVSRTERASRERGKGTPSRRDPRLATPGCTSECRGNRSPPPQPRHAMACTCTCRADGVGD